MNLRADSGETFSVPSELAGPLPRLTSIQPSGVARLVLAVIALSFAAGILFWAGLSDLQKAQQRSELQRSGNETIGRVTRVSTHLVDYTFSADGRTYEGEADLPESEQDRVQAGSDITVRYLPENPSISHPSAWEWTALFNFEQFIFPVVPGAFGFLIVLGLHKERRLIASGNPTVGIITKCISSRSHFEVTYEFHSENGTTLEARDTFESHLTPGTKVCVLYLTDNPLRNGLYPGSSYRVKSNYL